MLTAQHYPAIKVLDPTAHSSALRLLCHTNMTTAQAQEHTWLSCTPQHRSPSSPCPYTPPWQLEKRYQQPVRCLTAMVSVQRPAPTPPAWLFKRATEAVLEELMGNLPDTSSPRSEPFAHASLGATPAGWHTRTRRSQVREGCRLAPAVLWERHRTTFLNPSLGAGRLRTVTHAVSPQWTCWEPRPRQPPPVQRHTGNRTHFPIRLGLLSTAPRAASNTKVGQGGRFRMALPNTPCSPQRRGRLSLPLPAPPYQHEET